MLDTRFQQRNGIQLRLLHSVYTAQGKGNCASAHKRRHEGTQTKTSWHGPANVGDSSIAVFAQRPQKYKKLFTFWGIRNWRWRQPAACTWYCKTGGSGLLLGFVVYFMVAYTVFSAWDHSFLGDCETLRTRLGKMPLLFPGSIEICVYV